MSDLNNSSILSPLTALQKSTKHPNHHDSLLKSLAFSIGSGTPPSPLTFIGSMHNDSISSPKRDDGIYSLFLTSLEPSTYTDKILMMSNNINTQVAELDQKLDHILEKHEKDFLTAYRVYI